MEESYKTEAIIINRRPYRENDSLVTIYSQDFGKLSLVARGTKKISSKLAGHVEPVTLSSVMIIKGKHLDYVGSAVNIDCFKNIKSDFNKLEIVGGVIRSFDRMVKEGEPDKEIFGLLKSFLDNFNNKEVSEENYSLLYSLFVLRLLTELGYRPELYECVVCKKRALSKGNSFDYAKGGLICGKCSRSKTSLTISENVIKMLRFAIENDASELFKIKASPKLINEINRIVRSFYKYNF